MRAFRPFSGRVTQEQQSNASTVVITDEAVPEPEVTCTAESAENVASLTYLYSGVIGNTSSNAVVSSRAPASDIYAQALSSRYRPGSSVFFAVSFVNDTENIVPSFTLNANNGEFVSGDNTLYPLTADENAALFIGGVPSRADAKNDGELSNANFVLPEIPAFSSLTIIVGFRVNGFAPIESGSKITVEFSVGSDIVVSRITAEILVEDFADVQLHKTVRKSTQDGSIDEVLYELNNYGNTEATDAVLSDALIVMAQKPDVRVNGEKIDEDDFDYDIRSGCFRLPGAQSDYLLNVPPADFVRDPLTGTVVTIPATTDVLLSI